MAPGSMMSAATGVWPRPFVFSCNGWSYTEAPNPDFASNIVIQVADDADGDYSWTAQYPEGMVVTMLTRDN